MSISGCLFVAGGAAARFVMPLSVQQADATGLKPGNGLRPVNSVCAGGGG